MKRTTSSLLVLLASLFLSGCYPHRMTYNYEQFPLITDNVSTVLTENKYSAADEKHRLEVLKRWEETVLPEYVINAGDILDIHVYNQEDLSGRTTVTPDGCISMLFIGKVCVAGMTVQESVKLLEKQLGNYVKNPVVGISPVEINSGTVTISGSVGTPGIYPIANGMRLSDLFAKAGSAARRMYDGQVLDSADFQNSVFVRNGEHLPLDFKRAIEQGAKYHNVLLRAGDYVYIATRTESTVSIFGDVLAPQKKLWNNGIGMLEMLSYSGLAPSHWQYAIIIRGGVNNPTMYRIDIDGILEGRVPNVLLEPNDTVYVPHDSMSEFNVFVNKLMPIGQLANLVMTPYWWYRNEKE